MKQYKDILIKLKNFLTDKKGQAMVEYAVVFYFFIVAFYLAIHPFLLAYNNYVQGIYFILFQSYP
ncbi:MAG: hypothetical protein ACD_79C01026G0002 [uncultured bacterium]|nr:MAG: hypothetical protein ACD_79C01026G0002 [uncultured bacterium]